MMKHGLRSLLFALGSVMALSLVSPAMARSNATSFANGGGCFGCHNGGQTPKVTITSDVNPVPSGGSAILTVHVEPKNGSVAGFVIRVGDSDVHFGAVSMAPGESGIAIGPGGLGAAHTTPRSLSGGASEITFKVKWTAPTSGEGTAEISTDAISANNSRNTGGDLAGTGRIGLAFGCAKGLPAFVDSDRDSYGSSDYPATVCKYSPGYSDRGGDCDDIWDGAHPGVPEKCDGADNDCNGQIDDGLPRVDLYRDDDHDGWGGARSAGTPTGCVSFGYSDKMGDCDDNDNEIYPGAIELCNLKDDSCNKVVDEQCVTKRPDGGVPTGAAGNTGSGTAGASGSGGASVPVVRDAGAPVVDPPRAGSSGTGTAGKTGSAGVTGSAGATATHRDAGTTSPDDNDSVRGGCAYNDRSAPGSWLLLLTVVGALVGFGARPRAKARRRRPR